MKIDSDFVKALVAKFWNCDENELNILDWQFSRSGLLEFKVEDPEDGCARVYYMEIECRGYAKSLNEGNFDVEKTD